MRLCIRNTICPGAFALSTTILLFGCSDGSDNNLVRAPGPGPAPLSPELIMDETTPVPGFPMSFPDGIAVFPGPNGEELLFNEANRQRRIEIDSIDSAPLVHSVALEGAAGGGRDSNGQICQDAEGNRIFGEDTGQSADDATFAYAGWGVFDRSYNQVGKLTPTSVHLPHVM